MITAISRFLLPMLFAALCLPAMGQSSSQKPLAQMPASARQLIAITVSGKNYFYNYGVKSKETREPITNKTLMACDRKMYPGQKIKYLARH